jgi:transposase
MPGPPPQFQPSFPAAFLAEARRLAAARTAATHLRQRAELVLLLQAQPAISNAEVASRLDVHPNCVRRWRKRWAEGELSLEDATGRGRKRGFSPP